MSDERKGTRFSMTSKPGRPGEWVACSCGWASPDVAFPNAEEAFEWARREHPACSPEDREASS